jgi:hypothetical protein
MIPIYDEDLRMPEMADRYREVSEVAERNLGLRGG